MINRFPLQPAFDLNVEPSPSVMVLSFPSMVRRYELPGFRTLLDAARDT